MLNSSTSEPLRQIRHSKALFPLTMNIPPFNRYSRIVVVILILLSFLHSAALAQQSGVSREVWTNVGGNSVSQIPLASSPNVTDTLTNLESPTDYADNFGTRLRAYLTAPTTGSYTFWLASDDNGELWLSTDANPSNKVKLAWVSVYTNPREWTKEPNQKSAAVTLTQGQKYYIEALQKDGSGGDNLAVGWAKPGQSTSAPSEVIPGSVLTRFIDGVDKIRFYPREFNGGRMVGGIFEGSNGDPSTGPYTQIHTITALPSQSWNDVIVSLGTYRYLRYRSPDGAYCNVAEVEFYRAGNKITGVGFGSNGSYSGTSSDSFNAALDGNTASFFDSAQASGGYVGIDSGLNDKIRFYPRQDVGFRMVGGVFEGTNNDRNSGPYTPIHTITSAPANVWTEVFAPLGNYRYLRYRSPSGGYCNIAELEFYRDNQKIPGSGFGTPGSYSGTTADAFCAALDGSITTFFDYSAADGGYVGIDTSSGGISREVWTGVGGTAISQIPLTNAPNLSDTLTSFEAPRDWADNYGTRIRGYVIPPQTGNYTFWISSDDTSELWISPDANPASKVKRAWVASWTSPQSWNSEANQKSVALSLTQGQQYYIEALHKEGGGGDNLAVGWARPGESTASPSQVIPGSSLAPYTGLTREVWTGITGTGVAQIPLTTPPNITDILPGFEAPTNWGDDYGTRLRGYITAPQTGSYTFWISSDDTSELWISTNNTPASKVKRAWVNTWTYPQEWNREGNQKSVAITLTLGQKYYVEVLQKEGAGGDNLAVGWAKPGQSTTAPSEVIPRSVLSPFTGTTGTVPIAPTGLSASAGNTQVSLTWSASSGATSYNVKRSTTNGGPYTTVASPTGASYTNTGLTNGTTYYYVVTAVNSSGESGNSVQVSAVPNSGGTAASPPTGLTATPGNAQVSLSWTASSGATSYNVKRSTTNGGPYSTVASPTGTSYTNTGLTNGTTYYYIVTAVNSAGESGNSSQVSATPTNGAPAVPSGVSASPGNTQITLTWSASAGATSYNVKRATVNGGPYSTVASPTGTSYTNTGLTNGTTYYYVVSAVSGANESANSSQVSATPTTGAPPVPTGLSAMPGNAQVSLSWTASSGATSYNIKRSTISGGPFSTVGSSSGTTFNNTSLANGTTYYYVVTAVNSSAESGNSSQVSATPSSNPPSATPVRVEQPITFSNNVYTIGSSMNIIANLTQSANVTITVSKHLAGYQEYKWPYLTSPYLVKQFNQGTAGPGTVSVGWDGLDSSGQPVTELQNYSPDELRLLGITGNPSQAQLTKTVPVNLFQMAVNANSNVMFANFERGSGTVRPDRKLRPFSMAYQDSAGNFLVPDFYGGIVRKYSPNWVVLSEWGTNHSITGGYFPEEAAFAASDPQGNVFAATRRGVYRYGANDGGAATKWPTQGEWTLLQNFGHLLGKNGEDYSGMTVDDQGNVYLGRMNPSPCILVFNNSGTLQRQINIPDGRKPRDICWLGQNVIGVTGIGSNPEGAVFLIDAPSGNVNRRIEIVDNSPLRIWGGRDGTFIAGHTGVIVRRFNRSGDPLNFDPAVLHVNDSIPNEIRFAPHEFGGLPPEAPGFPIGPDGFAIGVDGNFYVSEKINVVSATLKTDLLKYSSNGTFQPQTLLASMGRHTPGNVFLDNTPATFDFYASSFSTQPQNVTVDWTLTNFEGAATTGTATLVAQPMAHQTLNFSVNAPAMGHYILAADVKVNGQLMEPMRAQMVRIPSRDTSENRYSPFAVCAGGECEILKLAGVKSHRSDSASWARTVEPLDGVFYPERPQQIQFGRGGPDSLRAYGRREGFLFLNGLNYGEAWLGGDWQGSPTHFIYSYDRYLNYSMRVLDVFSGKGEAFYQFWNEPDNFWRPGFNNASNPANGKEHFVMLQKHVWSIVKARDKNALAVADGNAGNIKAMEDFAAYNGTDWNDTVQMHYPAANVIDWLNIIIPDVPETKVPEIAKLVTLRDQQFPGKEVWNTEDAVPANPKTAQVAAANLPRMYVSQIAAGVDKIYMFSQTGTDNSRQDVTTYLDANGQPFPTFVAMATMSRLIEGATYAGQASFGDGAYGYLFARGGDFVLAANTVSDTRNVTIDSGGTLIDLMGRQSALSGNTLSISPRMQYVLLPRNAPGALSIATSELNGRLSALSLTNANQIPAAVTSAAQTAATDKVAMRRLHELIKAAQVAAAAGQAPNTSAGTAAASARSAVQNREGADGYVRSARLVLDWTERLAKQAQSDSTLNWALTLAAGATQSIASAEAVVYPGAAINTYIGNPGDIGNIRNITPQPDNQGSSIDDKFQFQINRSGGQTFEMELTVCNYYRHSISGTYSPRLPSGWTSQQGAQSYNLNPGQRARFRFTIQIPGGAPQGIYQVGGTTQFNGTTVTELHSCRVKL